MELRYPAYTLSLLYIYTAQCGYRLLFLLKAVVLFTSKDKVLRLNGAGHKYDDSAVQAKIMRSSKSEYDDFDVPITTNVIKDTLYNERSRTSTPNATLRQRYELTHRT